MAQRNAIQRWLDQSEHNNPMGRTGEITEPFSLGSLSVGSGELLVLDHWAMIPDEAVRISTQTGTHHVYATGIEIQGARRVSALWMHHHSADPMELETAHVGTVAVDSWGVVMGDLYPWLSDLSDEEDKCLGETVFGQYADGCERFELVVGEKCCTAFRSFSGRGSGVYDVYQMERRGASHGAYVEFLCPEDETA